ncbi:MAG: hypothetical protein ABIE74_01350 [Pseudomonadota bacterium]
MAQNEIPQIFAHCILNGHVLRKLIGDQKEIEKLKESVSDSNVKTAIENFGMIAKAYGWVNERLTGSKEFTGGKYKEEVEADQSLNADYEKLAGADLETAKAALKGEEIKYDSAFLKPYWDIATQSSPKNLDTFIIANNRLMYLLGNLRGKDSEAMLAEKMVKYISLINNYVKVVKQQAEISPSVIGDLISIYTLENKNWTPAIKLTETLIGSYLDKDDIRTVVFIRDILSKFFNAVSYGANHKEYGALWETLILFLEKSKDIGTDLNSFKTLFVLEAHSITPRLPKSIVEAKLDKDQIAAHFTTDEDPNYLRFREDKEPVDSKLKELWSLAQRARKIGLDELNSIEKEFSVTKHRSYMDSGYQIIVQFGEILNGLKKMYDYGRRVKINWSDFKKDEGETLWDISRTDSAPYLFDHDGGVIFLNLNQSEEDFRKSLAQSSLKPSPALIDKMIKYWKEAKSKFDGYHIPDSLFSRTKTTIILKWIGLFNDGAKKGVQEDKSYFFIGQTSALLDAIIDNYGYEYPQNDLGFLPKISVVVDAAWATYNSWNQSKPAEPFSDIIPKPASISTPDVQGLAILSLVQRVFERGGNEAAFDILAGHIKLVTMILLNIANKSKNMNMAASILSDLKKGRDEYVKASAKGAFNKIKELRDKNIWGLQRYNMERSSVLLNKCNLSPELKNSILKQFYEDHHPFLLRLCDVYEGMSNPSSAASEAVMAITEEMYHSSSDYALAFDDNQSKIKIWDTSIAAIEKILKKPQIKANPIYEWNVLDSLAACLREKFSFTKDITTSQRIAEIEKRMKEICAANPDLNECNEK